MVSPTDPDASSSYDNCKVYRTSRCGATVRGYHERVPTEMDRGHLYPRLLGTSWTRVHPIVQQSHHLGDNVHLSGTLTIEHGTTLLARMLAPFVSFAKKPGAYEASLDIGTKGDCECWLRLIGSKRIRSRQWCRDGFLLEAFWPLEFTIELQEASGGLSYRSRGAAARLLGLGIRIPRLIAPQIIASETAGADNRHSKLEVTVSTPVSGMIFRYSGQLIRKDSAP